MKTTTKTTNEDHFAKEGWMLIGVSLGLALIGIFIHAIVALIFIGFAVFTLYFFRNPKRVTPSDADAVICPADGTVIAIVEDTERYFSKQQQKRVTIFMSPFNVHVNRSPVTGTISNSHYQSGKFLAAFSEKASLENEQAALEIITPSNKRLVFVQIAGWLARRIISYPKKGDNLIAGEIFGVIRFGSRMDIYLPMDAKIEVALKQKVLAGETILARW